MGLVVAVVAKATMMTLCQCTRVKCSTTQQMAAAVAAVDGEDGVQWRQWGGRSMAKSAAQWTRRRHNEIQCSNHPEQ